MKYRSIDLEVHPSATILLPFLTYQKATRTKFSFSYYKLTTGYTCVDGLYPSAHEAMKAVMSEGLLILLLRT